MFAIAAVVLAVIAGLVAFGSLSGISAIGLLCFALACLAMHLVWPWQPWHH